MPNIKIDTRIAYDGNGDGRRVGPPHYFDRLAAKYRAPDQSDPAWLRRYFPDEAVRREFCYHRDAAFYYFGAAAKLRIRTTTGWHGRRTDGRLKSAGGTLARRKNQVGRGAEVKALEREIAQLRFRKIISFRLVRHHIETATYHWHLTMFLVCQYFPHKGGGRLPSGVKAGLDKWLSFPEIGIRCTPHAIRRAREHFQIERRDGTTNRVYCNMLPSQATKTIEDRTGEAVPQDSDTVPASWRYTCMLCGRTEMGLDEFRPHLYAEHGIGSASVSIDPPRREISLESSGEVVVTWREDQSKQGCQKPLANRDKK